MQLYSVSTLTNVHASDTRVVSFCVVIVWINVFSQRLKKLKCSLNKNTICPGKKFGVLYIHIWGGHSQLWCHIFIYGVALHLLHENMIYLSGEASVDYPFLYNTAIRPWWEVHCFLLYKRWKDLILLTSSLPHLLLMYTSLYNSPFTATLEVVIPCLWSWNYNLLFMPKWAYTVSMR